MEKSLRRSFAIFVLPTLLAFTLCFIVPFVMGIGLSFSRFTTVTNATFAGMANYRQAFADSTFLYSLGFTSLFAAVMLVIVNVCAFALAGLLTRGLKGTNVARTIFFLPNLIGGIVLGYIWQLIINGVLLHYDAAINLHVKYGFWGLVILTSWQMIGYMMIIYIAGMMTIPGDLLEAAAIDGADGRQRLFHIILPLMMPAITICSFLTLVGGYKLFDQNLALTAGEPARATEMLALNIYNTFYGRVGFEGVGQAKAVVFFIIVAAISLIQLHFTRRKEMQQ